jgi:ketosteroid isomerase-like protein
MILCLAALAVAAGCGESDQEQAREVVQDYVDARTDGDAAAECDLYSESYKEELAVADCPAFVQEQSSGGGEQELEVIDVRVNGDRGQAELDIVRGAENGPVRIGVLLERDDDEWKISGFQ